MSSISNYFDHLLHLLAIYIKLWGYFYLTNLINCAMDMIYVFLSYRTAGAHQNDSVSSDGSRDLHRPAASFPNPNLQKHGCNQSMAAGLRYTDCMLLRPMFEDYVRRRIMLSSIQGATLFYLFSTNLVIQAFPFTPFVLQVNK